MNCSEGKTKPQVRLLWLFKEEGDPGWNVEGGLALIRTEGERGEKRENRGRRIENVSLTHTELSSVQLGFHIEEQMKRGERGTGEGAAEERFKYFQLRQLQLRGRGSEFE